MPSDTEEGNPTRSGRIPNIKRKAAKALKSLIPKKRAKNVPAVVSNSAVAGARVEESSPSTPGATQTTPASQGPAKKTQKTTVVEVDDDDDNAITVASDDSQEELDKLKGDWNTPIYAFYRPTPTIGYQDGRRYHEFHCFASKCNVTIRHYLDTRDATSTGNLHKHAKKCWGVDTIATATAAGDVKNAREVLSKSPDGSIAAAFEIKGNGKVTYSHRQHTKTEIKAEIVRWVSENARPFSIVNDRGFKRLMKTGRPEIYLPSPSTVSRDVRLVFAHSRHRIAAMLRKNDGKLHFATDAWTSPNHRAYVALTVHFEHNGKPLCFILDVVEVAKSHTGINLAIAFADVLKEFGISEKVLSITCDNASNNDVMIDELEDLIPAFSKVNHTRCFLHVNNLVAKTLVKQFDVARAQPGLFDGNVDDEERELRELADEIDLEEQRYREATLTSMGPEEVDGDDDVEGWVDEMAALSQAEREVLQKSTRPVKLVLVKIRKLSFKIVNSTTLLLPAWSQYLKDLKLDDKLMPRDVQTRWNSTYDMLRFALDYRKAVDMLTGDRVNDLRKFELNEDEWKLVQQLCDVLAVLKDATLFFSRSTPNLASVIPVMDHINDRLTAGANNAALSPAIRSALGLAKKTLNRYYARTDDSEAYRIAMILHPRYKLDYFKKAKWEQEWIDTAEELLRAQYLGYKKDQSLGVDAAASSIPSSSKAAPPPNRNIFDDLLEETSQAPELRDEIDRYLSTDTEKVKNVLLWWWERRAMYPHLSRMALDYLSIPATSVDVERVFSRGRLLLSHVRSRLSAQSTHALLCVGSWSLLDMIKDSDVQAVAVMADEEEEEEQELEDGWDKILL